jgi:uncharacterized protein (DUF1501 family)
MLTRRALIQQTSLLALAPTVPAFLARTVRAARGGTAGHVLVVVQLDGGNDGLNTVVPFTDEHYPRVRPTLKLATDRLLKLDGSVGLHPALKGLAALHERGELAVVQGVGYPNPNRSHDVSMAIWHTARFEREEQKGHGWLGRALDGGTPPPKGVPSAVVAGADPLPSALFARQAVSASVNTLDEYAHADLGALEDELPRGDESVEDYVRRTTLQAKSTVERLRELARATGAGSKYPSTELARRLALVAELVKAGLETPVYYVVQPGYDTHYLQADGHARLLGELGDAVLAFRDDLASCGLAERVLLMTFSEFGRRVEENASFGTDHGTASQMFLVGPAVAAGLHGETPSLAELEDGDLKMSLDFRTVYATVLERWLGLSSGVALDGVFEPLPLLRG